MPLRRPLLIARGASLDTYIVTMPGSPTRSMAVVNSAESASGAASASLAIASACFWVSAISM